MEERINIRQPIKKNLLQKNCHLLAYILRVNEKSPLNELAVKMGHREYVYSVAVYQRYLTRLGELIIFELWRENYHFIQPRLIF